MHTHSHIYLFPWRMERFIHTYITMQSESIKIATVIFLLCWLWDKVSASFEVVYIHVWLNSVHVVVLFKCSAPILGDKSNRTGEHQQFDWGQITEQSSLAITKPLCIISIIVPQYSPKIGGVVTRGPTLLYRCEHPESWRSAHRWFTSNVLEHRAKTIEDIYLS